MLLPDNIHPENSIYFNASLVLETLQEFGKLDMLDLYEYVSKNKKMSFPVYILCLDWLYIINVAELNQGEVKLCS
ncbi:MAG: ABC-three component system middle component 6 [Flavobacterium circumlabens]|uniref:ABC-three component system middle component 6 n=1 Tax=Flavobacterium circumlabens TaxID=2133765 RepID=UPI003265E78B